MVTIYPNAGQKGEALPWTNNNQGYDTNRYTHGLAVHTRMFYKNKKSIKYIFVLLILGSLWYIQFWMRRYNAPQLFGETVLQINTLEKVVALTYDDGPNPPYTDELLETLALYNAKATFFVLGKEVKAHPETFQHIVMGGHEVGNHSWSHVRLTYKSPSFIKQEIASTDSIIRSLGYTGTIHFRAPFGHKLVVLPYLLKQMNRPHILWNIELKDWDEPSAEVMLHRLDEELRPGSIVLLHDGDAVAQNGKKASRNATVKVTKLILEKYQAKGYRFVTISELMELSQK